MSREIAERGFGPAVRLLREARERIETAHRYLDANEPAYQGSTSRQENLSTMTAIDEFIAGTEIG